MGAIVGAVAGGVAGSQGTSNSTSTSVNLANASALQNQANNNVSGDYTSLENDVNAGPGQQDVTNYMNNSTSLAAMLGQYAQSGGMPTSSDFSQGNSLASQAFQGQQTALSQSFQQQMQQANGQAAMMGRSGTDPTLMGTLGQSQMLQRQQLMANQGSYANQLAMQLPGQRLQYAGQQNQLLGGLATQALQNRQSILSMGSGILGQQQQYQLGQSGNTSTQSTPGGFRGALLGAMSGAGAGMQVASMGQMGQPGQGMPAQQSSPVSQPQGFGASSYASSGMAGQGSAAQAFTVFGS